MKRPYDVPAPWAFQNFDDLLDGLCEDVRRCHVNLVSLHVSNVGKHKVDGATLVMQTTTGTFNARAIAKCSLDIPMKPAFAPTIRMTQVGASEVSPYIVVFKY